jgi:hypothetical protein
MGEGIDEITDKIRSFRASLLALAAQMTDHPSGTGGPARLRVVRGATENTDSTSTPFESGAVEP